MKFFPKTFFLWVFLLFFTWFIHHFTVNHPNLNFLYDIGMCLVVTFAIVTWHDKKELEEKLRN